MNSIKIVFAILFVAIVPNSNGQPKELSKSDDMADRMIVRIAEIVIYSEYIKEYKAILKEESEVSVRIEPGVICIYPMYQKDNPTQIRLLEIYTDNKAYLSHLQSPHFKHYKTTTQKMIKSLKLVDMEAIDKASMPKIFQKLNL